MVGPLVQHTGGELLHPVGDAVLGDHRSPVAGDQMVDAVVDLRVYMIGAACQHDDALALTARLVDDLTALYPDLCHVRFVLRVGGIGCCLHLPLGDAAKVLGQHLLCHLVHKILGTVDAHIIIDELFAFQLRAVACQDLRVVGHHRAIIMVVAQALVHIVGQAGVEDGVQLHLAQRLDVAVAQLCREAGGIAGDGSLSGQIQPAGGHRAGVHRKAKARPEGVPEGQQFVKAQTQRDADGAALAGHRLVAGQQLLLVGVQVQAVILAFAGNGLIAAVAGDELAAIGKGVDGQLAMVAAAAALDADHLLCKFFQFLLVHHGRGGLVVFMALAQAVQGSAVSTHQTGNVRPDDLHAHLLFKGAEHGFIIKGTALHHDLAAQLFRAGSADHLVQRVLDHADGQACGNILDAGAILLRLLDRAVHEHGAAAAQVHRAVCEQTQCGKLLDVVAQRLRKGLQKAAAAGGTGFVQEDVADGTILDLEALHVLPADVNNEVHVRHKVLGSGKMRHRFHQTVITAESVLYQLLAVAGGGNTGHLQPRVLLVDLEQLLPNQRQRVAKVGLIVGVQNLALFVHHHQLDGGRTGVDADMHRPAVGTKSHAGHTVGHVPCVESLVLLLAGEQRRLAGIGSSGGVLVQRIGHLGEHKFLIGIQRSAQRHIQQTVFRAGTGHVQRFVKALAQHGAESERAAQIKDIALDGAALCQTGYGLVDHSLIDAGGDILGAGTLIDQRLHVTFCKHAAAGSDGIGALRLLGSLVHFLGAHLQQGSHLVDESTGAAGTAAVHAHLGAVGQKQDLGILAAQLNDTISLWHKALDRHAGGEHLLHKGHTAAVG